MQDEHLDSMNFDQFLIDFFLVIKQDVGDRIPDHSAVTYENSLKVHWVSFSRFPSCLHFSSEQ